MAKQLNVNGRRFSPGSKVLIKQVRSLIGRDEQFRQTLGALGLGRIGKSVEQTLSPAIIGMVRRVSCVLDLSKTK